MFGGLLQLCIDVYGFFFAAGQRHIVHMSQNVLTSPDYEMVVTRLVSSHYCPVSPVSSLQDWRSSADTLKVSAQIRDQPGKCDTRLARFTDRFGHTKLDGLWSYMTIYHRTFADVYVCTMFHLVKRGFSSLSPNYVKRQCNS